MGYRVIACERPLHLDSTPEENLLIQNTDDVAEDKLELAKRCGATKVVNSSNISETDLTRTGATVVVSGAQSAYTLGINATAVGGKVIAIGAPGHPIEVDGQSSSLMKCCWQPRRHLAVLHALAILTAFVCHSVENRHARISIISTCLSFSAIGIV